MSADTLSTQEVQKLVSELTLEHGPIAAKDWILTHIHPGVKQADAMSAMFRTYKKMVA